MDFGTCGQMYNFLWKLGCRVSPRRLADINGHDIFKDTSNGTNSLRHRPVSASKAAELAGTHAYDVGLVLPRSGRSGSARARKMDNLLSVAFISGKEELPVRCVSPTKSRHLQGTYSFSCPGGTQRYESRRNMSRYRRFANQRRLCVNCACDGWM